MVIPIGPLAEQVMTTILKKPDGTLEIIELDKFRFVPMLEAKSRGNV